MWQAGARSAARVLLALALVSVALVSEDVSGIAVTANADAAPYARRLPPDFFGVNAQWLDHLAQQGDDAALVRHVRAMHRLGIRVARLGPEWNEVEPDMPLLGNHRFDFSSFDREMRVLARFRIRPSILLVGTPSWARDIGSFSCHWRLPPPRSAADFASYAGAVVDRYGRGGSFWRQNPEVPYVPAVEFEVWNEPNWWNYWCPDINPTRYADLFTESAQRIHAADPAARVVLGGLVATNRTTLWPNGTMHGMETGEFLRMMLEARPDARGEIDAVGLHTYGENPAVHLNLLRYTRWRMRQLGLGRIPIVYNEFGWPTSGSTAFVISDDRRAAYLRRITDVAARTCGVIEIDPYTWATEERDPQDAEDWFGIVDPSTAGLHASARAYSAIARRFERKRPLRAKRTTCSP